MWGTLNVSYITKGFNFGGTLKLRNTKCFWPLTSKITGSSAIFNTTNRVVKVQVLTLVSNLCHLGSVLSGTLKYFHVWKHLPLFSFILYRLTFYLLNNTFFIDKLVPFRIKELRFLAGASIQNSLGGVIPIMRDQDTFIQR